jgi:hypothetical protein
MALSSSGSLGRPTVTYTPGRRILAQVKPCSTFTPEFHTGRRVDAASSQRNSRAVRGSTPRAWLGT